VKARACTNSNLCSPDTELGRFEIFEPPADSPFFILSSAPLFDPEPSKFIIAQAEVEAYQVYKFPLAVDFEGDEISISEALLGDSTIFASLVGESDFKAMSLGSFTSLNSKDELQGFKDTIVHSEASTA